MRFFLSTLARQKALIIPTCCVCLTITLLFYKVFFDKKLTKPSPQASVCGRNSLSPPRHSLFSDPPVFIIWKWKLSHQQIKVGRLILCTRNSLLHGLDSNGLVMDFYPGEYHLLVFHQSKSNPQGSEGFEIRVVFSQVSCLSPTWNKTWFQGDSNSPFKGQHVKPDK